MSLIYYKDSKKRKAQIESLIGTELEHGKYIIEGWMLNGCSSRWPVAIRDVATRKAGRCGYWGVVDYHNKDEENQITCLADTMNSHSRTYDVKAVAALEEEFQRDSKLVDAPL
jgi:hypothetical protein